MSLVRSVVLAVLDVLERDDVVRARLRDVLAPVARASADGPDLVPLARIHLVLGIPRTTAREAVRRGELRAQLLGRALHVRRDEAAAWARTQAIDPGLRYAAPGNPGSRPAPAANDEARDLDAADYQRALARGARR